jgi:hypothetical protein
LGDLASANLNEVGFQILFLNCCKEATMFLKNAFDFYGRCQPRGKLHFFIENLDICSFKRKIQLYLSFIRWLWLIPTIAKVPLEIYMSSLSYSGSSFKTTHFINFVSSFLVVGTNYRFYKKIYIFLSSFFFHCFSCKFLLGSTS